MDKFDKLLVKAIDDTFRRSLGDRNTLIIYEYLDRTSCPIRETPKKLDQFSKALRNLLGTSEGKIPGAPTILEDAIVKALSSDLGLTPDKKSRVFEDKIRRLKEKHNNGRCKKARKQ